VSKIGVNFEEFEKLSVAENAVAMMWFNLYSGFVFKTPRFEIVVDPAAVGEEITKLNPDIIIVSHEHFDHFDKSLVKKLHKGKAIIIAPGHIISELKGEIPEEHLRKVSAEDVVEHEGLKIIACEADHPSPEPLTFIIQSENGVTIYHAIDSRTFDGMKEIGEKYSIDVAIAPIGIAPGTSPREAARAIKMLKPKIAIPHHAKGGFEEFKKIIEKEGIESQVKIIKQGEIYVYEK